MTMADRSAFLGRVERAPGVLRRLAAVASIDRVQRAVGDWGRRSAMLAACFALAVQARAQEIVRAGFSDSPPISWRNASTNDPQGFAVSVFRAVAGEADFTMHADLMSFGLLLPSLTDKKIDVVTMSGTPERRRVAIFSQPFAKYGETLLVRTEDTTNYVELAQLKGKRVGSNAGGGWLDAARAAGAEIHTYAGAAQSLLSLEKGEIDAVVGNAPTYVYLLRGGGFPHVRIASNYVPRQTNELAFALRPADTALLDRINAALKKLDAESALAQLRTKWGF
jgi:polar amino acid transport system substrate-binding protein